MANYNITETAAPEKEMLHIDLKKHSVRGEVSVIVFIDKDTKQHVVYVPSLEVSGYGSNEKKASEMAKDAVDDFFQFLFNLPEHLASRELTSLGWKKNPFFKKDFSNLMVDLNGKLKEINAIDNKIERKVLTAA